MSSCSCAERSSARADLSELRALSSSFWEMALRARMALTRFRLMAALSATTRARATAARACSTSSVR